MAKRRTTKRKPARRQNRKKGNSTIWILAALAAGVAYLMSKGTVNVPSSGVLQQAHQDLINTAGDGSQNYPPLTGLPGLLLNGSMAANMV